MREGTPKGGGAFWNRKVAGDGESAKVRERESTRWGMMRAIRKRQRTRTGGRATLKAVSAKADSVPL